MNSNRVTLQYYVIFLFLLCVIFIIIYMKKFLDCDWLREMQFFGNTLQKKGNLVQKRGNKRGILIG